MLIKLPPARSPGWVLAESAAAAAFSLVSMLAIGRAIGPHAAGTGMVAISAFLVAEVLVGSFFPDALVRLRGLERRHVDSAATASALFGAVVGVVLALLGPLLARTSGEPQVAGLALALAPLLPVAALSGTASGLYLREQRFRRLAARLLLGQPPALAAGLVLAWAGAGAWAMIAVQVVATTATAVLMLGGGLGLRPRLDLGALRELMPIALPQVAGVAVLVGKYRLFLVGLGMVVTPGVLGASHFAFRIVDAALGTVGQTVSRVAMPRLCALQQDRTSLAEAYGDLTQLQALLGLPLCTCIALTAPDFVLLLLGPAWAGTGDAAQIVAGAAALTFLYGETNSLFVALGKAGRNLQVAVATLALPLLLLMLVRPHTPEGAALVWAAQSVLLPPVLAAVVLRELGRSPLWLARKVMPGVLTATAMGVVILAVDEGFGLRGWTRFLASVAIGGLAAGGVAWAVLGGRAPRALATSPLARPAG